MNGKKAKAIWYKAKELLIQWICNYIPDEERKKVTIQTVLSMMPKTGTHVYAQGKIILSAWSFKWIVKKVKKLSKEKDIKDITLKDINKDTLQIY